MSTFSVSFFRVSSFRHRGVVWTLLVILSSSFLPSVSMAQQPTATISALSRNVHVNGQKQGKGAILNAGDVIETQAGASVMLELSDGSLLAGTVNNGEVTFSLSFSRACVPCPIPPPPGWHTSWCIQMEPGNYTAGLDDNRALVFLDQPSCTTLVNPDPAVFVICPGGNPGCFHGRYPRMQ